jgi:hypothetical protein
MKQFILNLFLISLFSFAGQKAQSQIQFIHNNTSCCIQVKLECANACALATCANQQLYSLCPGSQVPVAASCTSCNWEYASVQVHENCSNLYDYQAASCSPAVPCHSFMIGILSCFPLTYAPTPTSCLCTPMVQANYDPIAGVLTVDP